MEHLNSTQSEALLNGPALAPPPGVLPQLDNPPNHKAAATTIHIVFVTTATLGIIMRLYTKAFVLRKVHLADCKY